MRRRGATLFSTSPLGSSFLSSSRARWIASTMRTSLESSSGVRSSMVLDMEGAGMKGVLRSTSEPKVTNITFMLVG